MQLIKHALNPNLKIIYQHTQQIISLNKIIKQYLPQNVQEHCNVGCFQNGCLNLIIDNPIWAAELRFYLPQLRDKLRQDAGLYQLSSIKIKIQATHLMPNVTPKKSHNLSKIARESLLKLSKMII